MRVQIPNQHQATLHIEGRQDHQFHRVGRLDSLWCFELDIAVFFVRHGSSLARLFPDGDGNDQASRFCLLHAVNLNEEQPSPIGRHIAGMAAWATLWHALPCRLVLGQGQ